ncbi:MAG: hypothetical protein ABIO45_12515, partial [Burkholderiaceae bacterium]
AWSGLRPPRDGLDDLLAPEGSPVLQRSSPSPPALPSSSGGASVDPGATVTYPLIGDTDLAVAKGPLHAAGRRGRHSRRQRDRALGLRHRPNLPIVKQPE